MLINKNHSDNLDGDEPYNAAENFLIQLSEYEGPLDLLLELSSKKKFDLTQISIAELARQYIKFIETAQQLRIEIAADYLVMATYLAWLKSKLLLPDDAVEDEEEFSAAQQAEILRLRLLHLEAIQNRGKELFERKRLGQDFFKNASANGIQMRYQPIFDTKLHDLLKSYAGLKMRQDVGVLTIVPTHLFTPEQMQERLKLLIGDMGDWTKIQSFMPDGENFLVRKSAFAGLLISALALTKNGILEIQQAGMFAPIYIRHKTPDPEKPKSTKPTPAKIVS